MAPDTTSDIADGLAPVLRVVGNRHRLGILHILSGGARNVSHIAQELGVSRRTADRHLAVLQDHGLVKLQPSAENGRIYGLDREKAALFNASFVSLMGRVGGPGLTATTELATSPEDSLPVLAPQAPEGCIHCRNGSFVREVLEDLDHSLVKAREFQVRLRQISSQVLSVQEEERKRIARELHDDTAQALTSVLVRLRLLERSARDQRLRARLAELRDLTGATLEGVRRMAIDLRPPMLDDLGLEAALKAHVEDFSRRWSIAATFSSGRPGRLPPEVELVLYRIVQEALSNLARHANASKAEVRLSRRGRTLTVSIEDDGIGFDVEAAKRSRESGLGLFGMEERLALIGGTLGVLSEPGAGTRVRAYVPLPRSGRR